MLLSELVSSFLSWAERFREGGTVENYRRHLERFQAHVGPIKAAEVKAHHLLAWGKTWHEIQAVQRLFSFAVNDAEYMDKSPVRRVKRPPLGFRKRILPRANLAQLFRKSTRPFRNFLFAMRESLCRPSEIRRLAWEFLFWPGKPKGLQQALEEGQALFVFDEFKGRKRRSDTQAPRVVPVSARLGRLLWRLSQGGQEMAGEVFRNSEGNPWTNNAVRLRMKWLRKKLNLSRDHRGENVVAYTIRHTMATEAAAAGVRDRILAELMGHTTTRTTARYQHLQVEHLQAAMKSLRRRRPAGKANFPH